MNTTIEVAYTKEIQVLAETKNQAARISRNILKKFAKHIYAPQLEKGQEGNSEWRVSYVPNEAEILLSS